MCSFLSTNSTLCSVDCWIDDCCEWWAEWSEEFIKDMIRRLFGSYNVMTTYERLAVSLDPMTLLFCDLFTIFVSYCWLPAADHLIKSLMRLFWPGNSWKVRKFLLCGKFKGFWFSFKRIHRFLILDPHKRNSRPTEIFIGILKSSRQKFYCSQLEKALRSDRTLAWTCERWPNLARVESTDVIAIFEFRVRFIIHFN